MGGELGSPARQCCLGSTPLLLSDTATLGRSAPFTHLPLLTESSQRFISIICIGHCEIRKSSIWANSDPAYWVRQGPESQALVPLPGGTEPGRQPTTDPAMGRLAGSPGLGRTSGVPTAPSLAGLTIHCPTLNFDALGFLNLNFCWHHVPSFSNHDFLLILSVPRDDKYQNLHSLEGKSKP